MPDLRDIDNAIVELKKVIEMADAVQRLKKNKDFKKIIIEYYGTDYASELVRAKAQPQTQDEKSQKFIGSQINAIGHLFNFLDVLIAQGSPAKDNLEEHEEERLAMIQEEANE